ncbi:MAG: hypothetical protein ABIJ47_13035 [Candidatus Bathyarchaeota archaeon]
MFVSEEQLREVRGTALRRRVWYKVLDGIERGIVNLTISVVGGVKSPTLMREISKILVKLRDALESAFTRHLEEYGSRKLVEIIKVALSFGNEEALRWGTDSFARLLAVNNYNNPAGWKQASG